MLKSKNKWLIALLFFATLTAIYFYLQSSSVKTSDQSLQEITKTENVKDLPIVSILSTKFRNSLGFNISA